MEDNGKLVLWGTLVVRKPPIKDIYEASGAAATFASKAQSYDDKGRGRSGDSLLRREQD